MSPKRARQMHFCMMVFWAINAVVVWFLPSDWRIAYLVLVSIYANFVGHWSGYSAERPSELEDPDDIPDR